MRPFSFSLLIAAFAVLAHLYLYYRTSRILALSTKGRRILGAILAALTLLLVFRRALRTIGPDVERVVTVTANSYLALALCVTFALVIGDLARLALGAARRVATRPRSTPPIDEGRRQFLAQTAQVGILAGGGLSAAYGAFRAFAPAEVSDVVVRLPRLPKNLDGLTIVQLSDIHVGAFIDRSGGIRSRYGTFFVTGNHEYYSGDVPWCDFLDRVGIQVLRNRRVSIGDAGGSFDLVGVDDWGGARRRRRRGYDLEKAVAGRDPERAAVLLAHQPSNFEHAAQLGMGLQLSGHTHGGQIFPMTELVGLRWKYSRGLYREDDSHIYVSRGCGFWGPPARIGSPPEIVKVHLTV